MKGCISVNWSCLELLSTPTPCKMNSQQNRKCSLTTSWGKQKAHWKLEKVLSFASCSGESRHLSAVGGLAAKRVPWLWSQLPFTKPKCTYTAGCSGHLEPLELLWQTLFTLLEEPLCSSRGNTTEQHLTAVFFYRLTNAYLTELFMKERICCRTFWHRAPRWTWWLTFFGWLELSPRDRRDSAERKSNITRGKQAPPGRESSFCEREPWGTWEVSTTWKGWTADYQGRQKDGPCGRTQEHWTNRAGYMKLTLSLS